MAVKVGIGGGRVDQKRVKGIFEKAKNLEQRLGVEILLMDADLVFGKEHIESAVEHATRAFERDKNVASTKMMEVLLYASGERQLSTANKKMGIGPKTRDVTVVVSDYKKLDEVATTLGIKRDDSKLEGRVEMLGRFGISKKAIASVPKVKVLDLVLERVAMVDMLK